MAGRPRKYTPEVLALLLVIAKAANEGDPHAAAWLRGEGRIVITHDFRSRFIRWDNQIERADPKYDLWRRSVFSRDNYKCLDCSVSGKLLNAHHVKNWADFPEDRFDVNNGQTLCEDCHVKRHPHLQGLLSWRKKRKTVARQS